MSPPALDYISNIEDLYLYKNRITAIPKDYFRACHRLSIFDMASNHLLYLPEMSYISQSLLELKLSHNRLRSLDVLIRSNWLHLRALSVKHNNISEIQSSLIKNAPSLIHFDISLNKLQSLPDFRWSFSSSNRGRRLREELKIYVEGNPWYCDQKLGWVRHGINGIDHMRFGKLLIEDNTGMTCRGPVTVNGSVLWDTSKYTHG